LPGHPGQPAFEAVSLDRRGGEPSGQTHQSWDSRPGSAGRSSNDAGERNAMTGPERENRDSNPELTLLRCGSCDTAWASRAGRRLLENDDRCLRCCGALDADDR
jgi:hypothetical protein